MSNASTSGFAAPATAAAAKSSTSAAALNTASVNVFAGVVNFAEGIATSIGSALKAATSSVTSGAVQAATNGTAVVSSFSDGEAAITDIKQAITDAKAGKWGNTAEDALDLLKHVFAILTRFGVNVPVVSAIVAALPEMPAVSGA